MTLAVYGRRCLPTGYTSTPGVGFTRRARRRERCGLPKLRKFELFNDFSAALDDWYKTGIADHA
jgi:hypothetical protein